MNNSSAYNEAIIMIMIIIIIVLVVVLLLLKITAVMCHMSNFS